MRSVGSIGCALSLQPRILPDIVLLENLFDRLDSFLESAAWVLAVDWALRIGLALHIVMRRMRVAVSLAWLLILLAFPVAGPTIYLLLGINWLGLARSKWAAHMQVHYQAWLVRHQEWVFTDWADPYGDPAQLSRIIQAASGELPLGGNGLQLCCSSTEAFAAMIADIDRAETSCNMEFYIWETGGLADEFSESLRRAALRGVAVRILVDAVGARQFLKSDQAAQLRQAGAEIRAALPVSPLRSLFYRLDLRMHRKILIVDERIGYVGSQNLADPKLFRKHAGFGQWIDAMTRVAGPTVDSLTMIFFEDWHFDQADFAVSNQWESDRPMPPAGGSATVQVVPSGPGLDSEVISQILINALYMADRRLVITTPYYVPDDALQRALVSASRRGVDVTLVVPERVDSRLVRITSRPFLVELAQKGVKVALFHGGMLHTKSITVDGDTSFLGSLNLDPRSIGLNFELVLAVYDGDFNRDLLALQQSYIDQSHLLNVAELKPPGLAARFVESCVRLLSPLL